MSSIVEICNMALIETGLGFIESLTETSEEARRCAVYYPASRDFTLHRFRWWFAQRRYSPAARSSVPDEFSMWGYCYTYPADSLFVHRVTYEGVDTPVAFELALDSDHKRVILTNQEDAQIWYTAKVVNSELYSPSFVRALALHIAAQFARSLLRDFNLEKSLLDRYEDELATAEALSATENIYAPRDTSSPWITARSTGT